MTRRIKELLAKIAVRFPVEVAKTRYFLRFGKFPNLKNPYNLNEKILYLKLYSNTSLWTKLADKYLVRKYVEDCGYADILIPLIGVWDNVSDIDFSKLPEKCMLKANNGDGKGTNLIFCKSKFYANEQERIKNTLQSWLDTKNIGALSAEPQYKGIPPRIIAEKYLEPIFGEASLIDYKIWCFNGKPFSILCCSEREENGHVQLGCYDVNWHFHPENMHSTRHHSIQRNPIPKPSQLDHMLEIAHKLSATFPEVRVDLYQYGNKVYFGELTFTSLGGMMNYYTQEYLEEMGKAVDMTKRY